MISIAFAQPGNVAPNPTTIIRKLSLLIQSVPQPCRPANIGCASACYGVAAGGSETICTLSPSAKLTGGCRMTLSPSMTPSLTWTSVP
jgi:hypothetical protein